MGEKCMDGMLYVEFNGELVSFGAVQKMEITPAEEPVINVPKLKRLQETEFTFTTRFFLKRVSRKRFVKKLMAGGVPRNVAATIAKNVRCTKATYGNHLWLMQVSGYLRPCGG